MIREALRAVAAVLCCAVLAGCTGSEESPRATAPPTQAPVTSEAEPSASATPSTTPTPEPEHFDDWVVGASPLPLRPDGFGEVRRTPRELRTRRLRTVDVLPPPADGRFHTTTGPVTEAFVRRTDLAWEPGCPVALTDLRWLELSFWGFDDQPHTGRLVVNASVAEDVVTVFRALFRARFPLEEMRLVTNADLDAPPTGDGNTTAAYACRPTVGTTTWSAHAYGLAVDVNPFQNPYRRGDLVVPELASSYLDRAWRRPGMIFPDGVVVRAFDRVGWTWGGTFQSVLDLQHFSATGR
ncbi:MAG TPA: M15 family metallopeptidase [Marmoricola sp.]|nr:M15 family metallopeptidase [Marmoricola sp.]